VTLPFNHKGCLLIIKDTNVIKMLKNLSFIMNQSSKVAKRKGELVEFEEEKSGVLSDVKLLAGSYYTLSSWRFINLYELL